MKNTLKNLFTKNVSIKLLSLLLAVILWLYVATVENRIEFYPGEIPIETKNLATNLAAVYDKDAVKIKISAPASIWRQLVQDDFVAYVDLENLSLGTYEVDVKVTSSVPGIQIIETDPEKIRVRLETAVTAKVSVVTKFEGKLASGYEVVESKIDPEKVEARGAKDVMNSITQATAVIRLNGEDRDIKEKIELVALDEYEKPMRFITFSPDKVEVSVIVTKKGGGKIVGIRPKITGTPAAGFWVSKVTFEPSTTKITGSEEQLKKIDFLETKDIDVSGLNQNRSLQIGLAVPAGVSLVKGESRAIAVEIIISLNPQVREISAGFSYTNLGSGLKVTNINPANVTVRVAGSAGILQALSSDNVVVNLDLSGKSTGTHSIDVKKDLISVPNGVAILNYLPSNITITIQ